MKLLSRIKNLAQLKPAVPKIDIALIQDKIGDEFFLLLNKVFENRQNDLDNSNYTREQIEELQQFYVKKNLVIAASSSLVPGPLGIFSALPELVLTMSNHMKMIYDYGCVFDKESFLNKDVLLEIPIHAFGGQTNLAAIQASRADLEDSPENILVNKAKDLGSAMIQKTLKKSVVKFVPIAGTIMMAIWAKSSTKNIVGSTLDFFDDCKTLTPLPIKSSDEEIEIEFNKIKALINLIESDHNIDEEEIKFIRPIIEHSSISEGHKNDLINEANKTDSNLEIDFSYFKKYSDEAENLMMDLSILAKRDGIIKSAENNYLAEIASEINYTPSMLKALIS